MSKRKQKALNAIFRPRTWASNCSLAAASLRQTWVGSCRGKGKGSLQMPESQAGFSSEQLCGRDRKAERGPSFKNKIKTAGFSLDSELSLGMWKRASIFTTISFVKVGFATEDENGPRYLLLVRNHIWISALGWTGGPKPRLQCLKIATHALAVATEASVFWMAGPSHGSPTRPR